jgi:hypothetical protein
LRAQNREIVFRNGVRVETPLLVPSLSSKGFLPIDVGDEQLPAPAAYLSIFGGTAFYESLLISAYDIYHEQVLAADSLRSGFASSPYAEPALLIVDSGWYESTQGSDTGQPREETEASADWTFDLYTRTIDSLDAGIRANVVSFDQDSAYDSQIAAAQEFFANRDRFISTIMLKPPGRAEYHHVKDLGPHAERLRAFDIIGVTEKELGNTIVKRLKALVELRDLLDASGVTAPIHIFGGLDPLYTPLYYSAGGEIFDGLSWLRYAYHDGLCISRDALPLINRQFDKRYPYTVFSVQSRNLDAIRELSRELKVFCDQNEDWDTLRRADVLRPAHDALRSAVKEKRGR